MNSDLAVVLTTLSVYLAVAISPGPNFALVSRLAVSHSRAAGLAAALGLGVAATCYAALTMAGLSALLDQVGWLARAIQIAGGCYLIYLGISAWRADGGEAVAQTTGTGGKWYGFRTGLMVAFANPKSIAFFVGLYALAIPASTSSWAKGMILAGGFAIEIVWYSLVSFLLSTRKMRDIYARSGRWIERAIGTLLAAFGVRLIAQPA